MKTLLAMIAATALIAGVGVIDPVPPSVPPTGDRLAAHDTDKAAEREARRDERNAEREARREAKDADRDARNAERDARHDERDAERDARHND